MRASHFACENIVPSFRLLPRIAPGLATYLDDDILALHAKLFGGAQWWHHGYGSGATGESLGWQTTCLAAGAHATCKILPSGDAVAVSARL